MISSCSTLYYIWPSSFLMHVLENEIIFFMYAEWLWSRHIILLNGYFCCYRNSFRNCFGRFSLFKKRKYWQKIGFLSLFQEAVNLQYEINFKYTILLNIPNLLTCKLLIQGVIQNCKLERKWYFIFHMYLKWIS